MLLRPDEIPLLEDRSQKQSLLITRFKNTLTNKAAIKVKHETTVKLTIFNNLRVGWCRLFIIQRSLLILHFLSFIHSKHLWQGAIKKKWTKVSVYFAVTPANYWFLWPFTSQATNVHCCLTCMVRLRLCQSYQDPRLWPKNQNGTEIALNSEGWWRDCSLLSSGNGSDKGSWREKREMQSMVQKFWTIFSRYYSKHVFFFMRIDGM